MVEPLRIGRVYKIIATTGNECYVGSTFNTTRDRFKKHKNIYKQWKEGKIKGGCTSFNLFEKYGIDSCKMILIKEYSVVDRRQLETYELLWIKKLKSVNKIEPCGGFLSKQAKTMYYKKNKQNIIQKKRVYREKNKEEIKQRHKVYNENNKEKIKQKRKVYCDKNKKQILQNLKIYREQNKEQLKQKKKVYREQNKEIISQKKKQKVRCDTCNCQVRKDDFKRHEKTLKHKNNLATSV